MNKKCQTWHYFFTDNLTLFQPIIFLLIIRQYQFLLLHFYRQFDLSDSVPQFLTDNSTMSVSVPNFQPIIRQCQFQKYQLTIYVTYREFLCLPAGASDYGRGMTQSLPLSCWSPEKSYMTSSRTATLIYIAAWFRVNESLFCNKFI